MDETKQPVKLEELSLEQLASLDLEGDKKHNLTSTRP